MALFKHFRGSRASLDAQPLHDGYAYFCVDDGTFHIDCTDAEGNLCRKQINAYNAEKLAGMTFEELKKTISWNDLIDKPVVTYEVNNEGVLYATLDGASWIGMQDDSLVVAQASSATLNNNELEVN